MRLGKLYPEKFRTIRKVVRRRRLEIEKAIEIEVAWRIHLRRQGEHPKGSLILAADAALRSGH